MYVRMYVAQCRLLWSATWQGENWRGREATGGERLQHTTPDRRPEETTPSPG